MNINNKEILAHMWYSNLQSRNLFRENSIDACIESSNNDNVSIIELDVRKSSDWVLYCYHW